MRKLAPPDARIQVIEKGGKDIHHPGLEVFRLRNVGRDLGGFLWYVCEFYEALAGDYIFTSANLNKWFRKERFIRLLRTHCSFSCSQPDPKHGLRALFETVNFSRSSSFNRSDWTIHDGYTGAMMAAYDDIGLYSPEFQNDYYLGHRLHLAPARPFMAWYSKYLGNFTDFFQRQPICLNGIFRTTAQAIRRRPKNLFCSLREQTQVSNYLEVLFFLERSAASVCGGDASACAYPKMTDFTRK